MNAMRDVTFKHSQSKSKGR